MQTKLGVIHGHVIYASLNHKGKGCIWLSRNESEYGFLIMGSQVICCLLSVFFGVEGPFFITPILVFFGVLPFVFNRSPYVESMWRVGPSRSLFRMPVATALLRITKLLNEDQVRSDQRKHDAIKAGEIISVIQKAIADQNG